MAHCYTKAAVAKLGPRKDGDAHRGLMEEVPGTAKYGYIDEFWFYDVGSNDDPAFGLRDIQITLWKGENRTVLLEMDWRNDGHQGGSGSTPYSEPLKLVLRSGEHRLATVEGIPYNVPCHSSGIGERVRRRIEGVFFDEVDNVLIPEGTGFSVTC